MNEFEKEIKRSLKIYFPFSGSTAALSYRYKREENLLPDFFAFNGTFYFFECKSSSKGAKRFYPRHRVKEHQYKDLKKCEELGGKGYVLLNFRLRKPKCLVIPVSDLRRKVITYNVRKYIQLKRKKKEGKYYWDMSVFQQKENLGE